MKKQFLHFILLYLATFTISINQHSEHLKPEVLPTIDDHSIIVFMPAMAIAVPALLNELDE